MKDIKNCCCIQEMDVEKATEEIRQKEKRIKEKQERLKKEFRIDVTKTEDVDGISQYIKETKQKLKRQEEINVAKYVKEIKTNNEIKKKKAVYAMLYSFAAVLICLAIIILI